MFDAARRAFADVISPAFRTLFLKAVGLSIALFAIVFVAVEIALTQLVELSWPWLDTVVAVAAGLGLIAAFFFLMPPVIALFAGLYLDEIARLVEERDYPEDKPGRPLNTFAALVTGLEFAGLVLLVNILVLPTIFFGIGVFVMLAANSYLLGREYFQMIAMRHLPIEAARRLRRDNAIGITAAGSLPATLSLIPVVNLTVPLFATAFFVHLFKRLVKEEERQTAGVLSR